MRTCQEAVKQSTVGQCKKASVMERDEENPETDGLLLEGEEQEYFLELLMRTVSPERPKASQPTESKGDFKSKAATAKGKEKKRTKGRRGRLVRRAKRRRKLASRRRRRRRRIKPAG